MSEVSTVTIAPVKRVFMYNERELPDPDPTFTPTEVMEYYSGVFPELVAGKTNEGVFDEEKGVMTIEIEYTAGTKS